jgi:hypothetical protein
MYKPKAVPEVLAAKTGEFWGSTKYLPSDSVNDYYNRFQELLEELNEDVETIKYDRLFVNLSSLWEQNLNLSK